MSFLLDTCVISELVRRAPSSAVKEWLRRQEEHHLFLSALTLGEIEKGIAKLAVSHRRTGLQSWLDDQLEARFRGRILGVTSVVARRWGKIQAGAERSGRPLPVLDGLLAATALTHSLKVVTRNERDFIESGAEVVNPWLDSRRG